MARLEQILKLLDNEEMDPSDLDPIKDDVEYYVESAAEDDGTTGAADEFDIYEELNLGNVNVTVAGGVGGSASGDAEDDTGDGIKGDAAKKVAVVPGGAVATPIAGAAGVAVGKPAAKPAAGVPVATAVPAVAGAKGLPVSTLSHPHYLYFLYPLIHSIETLSTQAAAVAGSKVAGTGDAKSLTSSLGIGIGAGASPAKSVAPAGVVAGAGTAAAAKTPLATLLKGADAKKSDTVGAPDSKDAASAAVAPVVAPTSSWAAHAANTVSALIGGVAKPAAAASTTASSSSPMTTPVPTAPSIVPPSSSASSSSSSALEDSASNMAGGASLLSQQLHQTNLASGLLASQLGILQPGSNTSGLTAQASISNMGALGGVSSLIGGGGGAGGLGLGMAGISPSSSIDASSLAAAQQAGQLRGVGPPGAGGLPLGATSLQQQQSASIGLLGPGATPQQQQQLNQLQQIQQQQQLQQQQQSQMPMLNQVQLLQQQQQMAANMSQAGGAAQQMHGMGQGLPQGQQQQQLQQQLQQQAGLGGVRNMALSAEVQFTIGIYQYIHPMIIPQIHSY